MHLLKIVALLLFILYHSTPSGRQSFGSGVSRFFLTFFFGCNSGRSGTSLGRKLIVFTSIIYHNSYSKNLLTLVIVIAPSCHEWRFLRAIAYDLGTSENGATAFQIFHERPWLTGYQLQHKECLLFL